MERNKRTINKLFVVVALVLTIALCCALFGCGEKVKDGASDQDTSPIVTEPLNPDQIIDGPDEQPSETGFYIRAEIEEKEEYNIDEITIDLIYGVDINMFNYTARETQAQRNLESSGIYVNAYNMSDYYTKHGNRWESFDYTKLYYNLVALEEGEVNDGVFLIDEIPHGFTNGYILGGELVSADKQYLTLDNLIGTDYEVSVNNETKMVTCYKRASVNLPRELFSSDEGRIEVSVFSYGSYRNGDREYLQPIGESFNSWIWFDYVTDGDKVILSDFVLGCESVIDGTASANK